MGVWLCLQPADLLAATPLASVRVASGLSRPVFVTAPPQDYHRVFIVEQQTGIIKILNLDTGVINATPFLDIDGLATGNEQGLLGLAFHPGYDNNGLFYVNLTIADGTTEIRRYQVSADPDIADAGSMTLILSYAQPFSNHNGGWTCFGPDGYLYISAGDGGSGNDPGNRAQDITDQLLGKLLRIDVNGDDFPADPNRNYAIPPDNPFVGVTGDDEIWAYGLRNPWRCSFDRATDDLYIADVGQDAWEEIDFQPASSTGGENYGWRCMEATHCTGLTGCTCNDAGLTLPIYEYSHGGSPSRCSITGGYVYRGCAIPDLQGTYFFADYCSNQIWSFRFDGFAISEFTDRTAELAPNVGTIASISSFGEDAYGELYVCDLSGGEVFKIVPAGGPPIDCNNNGVADDCEILDGSAADVNHNGMPDDCECIGDVNGDGFRNVTDFTDFAAAYGSQIGDPNYDPDADINADGFVNVTDFSLFAGFFRQPCP
jgi:glucose/arabinose dehydrogenase